MSKPKDKPFVCVYTQGKGWQNGKKLEAKYDKNKWHKIVLKPWDEFPKVKEGL